MRHMVLGLAAVMVLSAHVVAAGEISKDASARMQQVTARAEKLASGKVSEYAREYVEASKLTLFAAQAAAAGGNEKLALKRTELAELQLTVAEAKAAQKEQAEEVALSRAELKRLEAQLERYMQPEEK